MTEQIHWEQLRSPQLKKLAEANAIVIVPVGSTEQHGPHLPVKVDALLATEVARRSAQKVQTHQSIVVMPTVWCGLAEHHMDFCGTLTLDFETFHALLKNSLSIDSSSWVPKNLSPQWSWWKHCGFECDLFRAGERVGWVESNYWDLLDTTRGSSEVCRNP